MQIVQLIENHVRYCVRSLDSDRESAKEKQPEQDDDHIDYYFYEAHCSI